MAEVFGTIGNEHVELNNAATEATLRLLYQATLNASKQQHENVAKMVQKAGLDPVAVAAANNNLKSMGDTAKSGTGAFFKLGVGTAVVEQGFRKVDAAISPLIGKLMDGTNKASDVFTAFEKLPGPIGAVAGLFAKLARFQEDNLLSYQSLTDAGINFGGSLTNMRMAAQNSYMTMDNFAKLMKANSSTFAKMGGTVNDGAMAFSKLSNSLLKSEAGDSLRNLGYTTDQVNQGMASYIEMTGGRNSQELKNTKEITAGATAYLSQLDALAEITGKSREEQQKELQEKMKNAQWEAKLQGMSEEEKKKATVGLANALAVGGKGAADAFQSKIMGVPPLTKEAQMFTATMGKTNESVMRSANNVTDSNKTVADQNKELVTGIRANEQDVKKFGSATSYAMGIMGSEAGKTIAEGQARANRSSKQSDDALNKAIDIEGKKKALAESEAAAAVATQKAIQEMGQSIMALLLPVIKLLTPAMNFLVSVLGAVTKVMGEFKTVTYTVVAALAAYLVIQKTKSIMAAVANAKAAGGKGGVAGILEVIKGGGKLGALGSKDNPMYVIIAAGGGAAGSIEDLLGEKGGKGGKGAKSGTGTPSTRADRLAKVSKGRAVQSGLKSLKGAGAVGALAGVISLGSDLKDINEQVKAGNITAEEAKKQQGGAVGEAGGGALGAWGGAAAGAAIGSVVPVIGTLIGGLIGGALGAYGGGALGKAAGEGLMGGGAKSVPKPQLADGGIVSTPTTVLAGEAGPEAILPLKHLETLKIELQTLNKQTAEMLRYLKETADYTRRTVDATRSLGGDLFKF